MSMMIRRRKKDADIMASQENATAYAGGDNKPLPEAVTEEKPVAEEKPKRKGGRKPKAQ